MNALFVIAVGGALGSVSRFLLASYMQDRIRHEFLGVPLSTVLVNVIGSLLIGLAYVLINEKFALGSEWRHFAMVGFLAAFTTFSTFSLDTVQLLESGHFLHAFAYIMGSVSLCVVACWMGVMLARTLTF